MDLILELMSQYANWIYLLCVLGALLSLRAVQQARRDREASLFTLEKESAGAKGRRAFGFMVAFLVVGVAVALVDLSILRGFEPSPTREGTIETPLVLPSPTPTSAPTPGPLEPSPTPKRPPRPTVAPSESPTAVPPVLPGCSPQGIITSPQTGAHVRGVVEIRGTASIGNLEYWKVEYALGHSPSDADFHWIFSGYGAVVDGLLYNWTPPGVSGPITLRLVVVDTTGNYGLPVCQVAFFID